MTTLLTETDPAFAVRPQRFRPAWDSQGRELGCNIIVAHMSEVPKPYVYVGREMGRNRPASPLGNPYRTGDDKIGRFKRDLFTAIKAVQNQRGDDTQRAMVAELLRIQTEYAESGVLNLACWCAPEACHADVIASAVVWLCSELPPEAVAGGWAMWGHGCAAEGLPWVTLGADGRLVRASKSLRIARSRRADTTITAIDRLFALMPAILRDLRPRSAPTHTLLSACRPGRIEGTVAFFYAPSPFHVTTLRQSQHQRVVIAAVQRHMPEINSVEFVMEDGDVA